LPEVHLYGALQSSLADRPPGVRKRLTWALFGTNQRAAEEGLISARIPEDMRQGINGWVEEAAGKAGISHQNPDKRPSGDQWVV
jgi:hypothetical protein